MSIHVFYKTHIYVLYMYISLYMCYNTYISLYMCYICISIYMLYMYKRHIYLHMCFISINIPVFYIYIYIYVFLYMCVCVWLVYVSTVPRILDSSVYCLTLQKRTFWWLWNQFLLSSTTGKNGHRRP